MSQEDFYSISVPRLYEYLPFDTFEWNKNGISLGDIDAARADMSFPRQSEPYSATFAEKGDDWHIGRILYFIDNPARVTPISLDCECDGGFVYALPVLLDGHHRYAAALVAQWPVIISAFGGRVDLLKYLCCETDTPPQE